MILPQGTMINIHRIGLVSLFSRCMNISGVDGIYSSLNSWNFCSSFLQLMTKSAISKHKNIFNLFHFVKVSGFVQNVWRFFDKFAMFMADIFRFLKCSNIGTIFAQHPS